MISSHRLNRLIVATFSSTLKREWDSDQLLRHAVEIGLRSIPIVVATGLFTGMVVAVQSYYQFSQMSASSLVGPVVGVAMFSELGPVLTGLMLTNRVGGAMCAELGTMRVTEQIDALKTLSANPVSYLIVPRLVACVLMTPVLTLFSCLVGIAAAWMVSSVGYGIDSYFYMQNSSAYVTNFHIVSGLIKSILFGGLIALICCFAGYMVRGGAAEVGKATTRASVLTAIAILVANFFSTLLLNMFYNA